MGNLKELVQHRYCDIGSIIEISAKTRRGKQLTKLLF